MVKLVREGLQAEAFKRGEFADSGVCDCEIVLLVPAFCEAWRNGMQSAFVRSAPPLYDRAVFVLYGKGKHRFVGVFYPCEIVLGFVYYVRR